MAQSRGGSAVGGPRRYVSRGVINAPSMRRLARYRAFCGCAILLSAHHRCISAISSAVLVMARKQAFSPFVLARHLPRTRHTKEERSARQDSWNGRADGAACA